MTHRLRGGVPDTVQGIDPNMPQARHISMVSLPAHIGARHRPQRLRRIRRRRGAAPSIRHLCSFSGP